MYSVNILLCFSYKSLTRYHFSYYANDLNILLIKINLIKKSKKNQLICFNIRHLGDIHFIFYKPHR